MLFINPQCTPNTRTGPGGAGGGGAGRCGHGGDEGGGLVGGGREAEQGEGKLAHGWLLLVCVSWCDVWVVSGVRAVVGVGAIWVKYPVVVALPCDDC